MNYQQTLEYLFSQLPMFQRVGGAAYKVNLDNTHRLMELLHHPENAFKSIHVAGTNGKGSTSHMLASVFQEAGYKTGLYTSPHLLDFRERVKINGKMISEQEVIDFVEKHKEAVTSISPSFFEWTVALAFDYFKKEKVDIAIIEVGMGGRLDSTNVITPEVSIITNIGLDHTQFLGDTLEKIAAEKGGIIKSGIPLVVGETQSVTKLIFQAMAFEKGTSISFADEEIMEADYTCELKGIYQKKNIKTVLAAISKLRERGWNLPEEAVKSGIARVITNTGLMGRWQVLSENPLVVADTGHNEHGIKEVLKQIEQTPHKQLHIVLGMVSDKNHDTVLSLLPKNATYYFCCPEIPRGLNVEILRDLASKHNLIGVTYKNASKALKSAKSNAQPTDLIFVGGSTFVVADVLKASNMSSGQQNCIS